MLLLGDIDAGEDILQTGFFDSKARIAYLKQFEASNEELSRRWFGGSNVFSIPADELARYVAQDAAMSPQAIKQAVQVRLRHLVEYLANASNFGHNTSHDGAIELRDAAMAAIGRGEFQQALEGLQKAHPRRPTGPMIRLQLARVLLELGRAEEASLHLESLTDFPAGEPLLSELRARVKSALCKTTAGSTKNGGALFQAIKSVLRSAEILAGRIKQDMAKGRSISCELFRPVCETGEINSLYWFVLS